MPNSKPARECILQLNEDTGEINCTLPEYEDDEFLTFPSLLFVELASRLATDPAWCEELVLSAEQRRMSDTAH